MKSRTERRHQGQMPPSGMNPGDQAPPGTPGTGENLCTRCSGSGKLGDRECPDCGGTGYIIAGVSGA